MKQFRVTWSASSNISFQGESDWEEWWGDPEDTADEIEAELTKGTVPEGLSYVIEASGFEWGVEVEPAPPQPKEAE